MRLTPVSGAEATVQLLTDSLDAVRIGPAAVDAIAVLVNGARCWTLEYPDATSAAELLSELDPANRRGLSVVHNLRPPRAVRGGPISFVRFDGSAALIDANTRSAVLLTEAETSTLEGRVCGDMSTTSELDRLTDLGIDLPQPDTVPPPRSRCGYGLPGNPTELPIDSAHLWQLAASAGHGNHSGVAADLLVRGGADRTDSRVSAVFATHHRAQVQCSSLEAHLTSIVATLSTHQIEPLLGGRLALAWDGMLPLHLTDYDSIDLVVDPRQRRDATRTLVSLGYSVEPSDSGPTTHTDPTDCGSDRPTTVRITTSLAPTGFPLAPDTRDLRRRGVPIQCDGNWYLALHPNDRFIQACVRLALSRSVDPAAARDVAVSAPRSNAQVTAVISKAWSWGLLAIVQRASTEADTLVGGIPAGLLAGPGRRPASAVQRALLTMHRRHGPSPAAKAVGRTLGRIGTGTLRPPKRRRRP